jgi:Phage portal protein, lambda family
MRAPWRVREIPEMKRKPPGGKRQVRGPKTTLQGSAFYSGMGGFAPFGTGYGPTPISEDSDKRNWRPRVDRDLGALLNTYRHRSMIADGRWIYGNMGQVSGAVRERAAYAIGTSWLPRYKGRDAKFKEAFDDFIVRRWLANCELRGSRWPWQAIWRLGSVSLDRDGDFFILFVKDRDGYPRLQIVEAHRIGSPAGLRVCPVKPYEGYRAFNGIICDENLVPRAINLLPPDSPWGFQQLAPVWHLIPVESVLHVGEPEWFSETRGTPSICRGILDWFDLHEINEAVKTGVKARSRISMVESNDTGRADLEAEFLGMRAAGDTSLVATNTKNLDDGLIRYLRAGAGHKIEAFSPEFPGADHGQFYNVVARNAHRGMDWPLDMHDLSQLGGASIRALVSQVQRSTEQRQTTLTNPALACVMYAVASAMEMGRLPFTEDWDALDITLPPKFSVDVGRDGENRRKDVAMGLRSPHDVWEEEGEPDTETILTQRAELLQLRNRIATEHGLAPTELLNLAPDVVQPEPDDEENDEESREEEPPKRPKKKKDDL